MRRQKRCSRKVEIKRELGELYLDKIEFNMQAYQHFWDPAKMVLSGMFIAVQAYRKNQEKSQINNQMLHLPY